MGSRRMKIQLNVGKQFGFTIVEMLALIVMLTILVTGVVPGYQDLVRNTQATTITDRLAESFRIAQSEAIKRGVPVTVCPISGDFNPTGDFDEGTEQWPCVDTNNWNAWKVFADPNFDGAENFDDGWPIILYVKNDIQDSITSNIAARITYDPMGFANINPTDTRSGWSWSGSYSSGEWGWSYGYSSDYSGAYYRAFTVTPDGCTGNNGRLLEITQTGTIKITNTTCS